ncbi:MAG: ABC-F family ATP-binding cassette domain-containing protein [Planctomycetes bacterium]|nr:ABC-F family ATP-binding cassette domain-containing protein [Planctomycetota bacterium]
MACLAFENVFFAYDTLAEPIVAGLSVPFPDGWTGIVGPNGAGKTTLLLLAAGLIEPLAGTIHRPRSVVYCPQRTDEPPEGFDVLLAATDAVSCGLRGRLGIGADWPARWDTLSHGERKRAQIATALGQRPEALALDEPTNHIDADGRALLRAELAGYDGVGLLVSHDRELLDGLCRQCLFLDGPGATLRPGGYTAGAEQARAETESLRRRRGQAAGEVRKLRKELVRRREKASREHRDRSKRKLARHDSDGRARIDAARVADSKAGQPLRQLRGRQAQAQAKLADLYVKKEANLGIWLPEARSRRDRLLRLEAGSIPLGADGRLVLPELAMGPADRVAVTGPNGAGKSTLVRHLLSQTDLPADKVLYIPQELDAERSRQVVAEVRGLRPSELGVLMTMVSRLGSDPQRLLETDLPSPGETRKLLLAIGAVRAAHLIVMDEPTNHLDLPSIEALETALAACPCGLVLVSHDLRFLGRLATIRWDVRPMAERPGWSQVRVGAM